MFKRFLTCPICAAVVLAWSVLLILMLLGQEIDRALMVILMSMSLGALAEKFSMKLGLAWKSGMVVLGLPMLWFLFNDRIANASWFLFLLIILTLFKAYKSKKGTMRTDRFKDCC